MAEGDEERGAREEEVEEGSGYEEEEEEGLDREEGEAEEAVWEREDDEVKREKHRGS